MRWVPMAATCCLVAVAGCGGTVTPQSTYEVKGKVTLPSGVPLAGGVVYFEAVENKGRDQFTDVSSSGDFSLVMLPGQYRVAFDLPERRGNKASKVPTKYQNFKTTDLEVTIDRANPDLSLAMK